jgi:hypothetical protein
MYTLIGDNDLQAAPRPARSSGVRIAAERVEIGGRGVLVVHNYGHGGSGITLHWGCVQEAVALGVPHIKA